MNYWNKQVRMYYGSGTVAHTVSQWHHTRRASGQVAGTTGQPVTSAAICSRICSSSSEPLMHMQHGAPRQFLHMGHILTFTSWPPSWKYYILWKNRLVNWHLFTQRTFLCHSDVGSSLSFFGVLWAQDTPHDFYLAVTWPCSFWLYVTLIEIRLLLLCSSPHINPCLLLHHYLKTLHLHMIQSGK